MAAEKKPLTLEELKHRRALRAQFAAGLFTGIAEGVFFCWLASVL